MSTDAVELRGRFAVPADHPCLAGHFPGDPIVPAVLLLDLGCALLGRLRPDLGELREVRSVKFVHPVRPEEEVEAVFTAGGVPGSFRFSCSTASGLAVQGQLLFEAGQ